MNILSEHCRNLRNVFAVLLACISTNLVGCAGSKAGAPPPPPRPLLAEIPPVPYSTLRIPIQVDLDYLGGKILSSVPRPLSQGVQQKRVQLGGGIPFAPSVGVEFRHRAELEHLDLRLDGDQLQAVARVGFAVGGSVVGSGLSMGLASCGERTGEPSAAIDFTLRGTLSWGDDAKVRLQALPWEMRWVRPCELTAFKVRLEEVLDLPMVRDKVQGAITQAVQKIPEAIQLRPMAEKAWKAMEQPRLVLPGILLLVRPDSVTASPLSGTGKTMQSILTVFAQPVLTDTLSPSDTLKPLPPIRIAPPAGDAFQLEAMSSVPLSVVDSLLSATLSGRTFNAGGRVVKIAKARIYGGGDKAVLGVTLIEPFAGEIFLKGKPLFDSSSNTVRLAEVDFDLQTRSFLTNTADFLLHGTIKDAIAKAAVLDLTTFLPRLADLRIPTGDVGEVGITLQRLRPMAISLDKDHLRAWLGTEGRAVYKVGTRQIPSITKASP